MQITKRDAQHAVHRYEALKKRVANIRESAKASTEQVVASAETFGAAFAMGVVQGRTGGVELFGVPIELGLGLGLNAFALLGGAGEASKHLNAAGNGCLAAYATTLGRGVGGTWKDKAEGTTKQVSTQTSKAVSGGTMSPAQVAMHAAALQGA